MDHQSMRVMILAAGKGERMGGGELPKVLHEVAHRPMIDWVRDAVAASGVDRHPIIVVGYGGASIRAHCGDACAYAEQAVPRGTGDAVRAAEALLWGKADHVLVLYGDTPCINPDIIRNIADVHRRTNATMTMMTAVVPDFFGWRSPLFDFGRVYRDAQGAVKHIIERRDASADELAIREVNSGVYCFKAPWLWDHLPRLTLENAQREYYLTDLTTLAVGEGAPVATVTVDPMACLGVNTAEQQALIHALLVQRRSGILAPESMHQRSPSSSMP